MIKYNFTDQKINLLCHNATNAQSWLNLVVLVQDWDKSLVQVTLPYDVLSSIRVQDWDVGSLPAFPNPNTKLMRAVPLDPTPPQEIIILYIYIPLKSGVRTVLLVLLEKVKQKCGSDPGPYQIHVGSDTLAAKGVEGSDTLAVWATKMESNISYTIKGKMEKGEKFE